MAIVLLEKKPITLYPLQMWHRLARGGVSKLATNPLSRGKDFKLQQVVHIFTTGLKSLKTLFRKSICISLYKFQY